MKGLIERMFEYETDVALVETEIFAQPTRMEVVFNCIDLSFQLFPTSSDEAYRTHAKYLHSLWKYYDRKASLNPDHSESIIDIFRYCIRKDPYLAKYLDQQTEGVDEAQNMNTAHTANAPQPSSMEVDTQSN